MEQSLYIKRCIQLAELGIDDVAPNPVVGAVLVYKDRIIGEGYHKRFGEAHAEVNCIKSVSETDRKLISKSTLFVSLEPCTHYGKTPPCADLIIQHQIPHVVIGSCDPFKQVNGRGINKLSGAGVKVEMADDLSRAACEDINKRFFCFHKNRRPYIILKWAQTSNGFIAADNNDKPDGISPQRLKISNEYADRLVHKWRKEEAAILVGAKTALQDDPQLTNRYWPGHSPVRVVIDPELTLPPHLKIFNNDVTTIVFNHIKHEMSDSLTMDLLRIAKKTFYYQVDRVNLVSSIADALYHMNITSLFVEGGAKTLHLFLQAGLYDEIRIITGNDLTIRAGLKAPEIKKGLVIKRFNIKNDNIEIIKPVFS